MANHSSQRTMKVCDRRQDDISLDEVERIPDLAIGPLPCPRLPFRPARIIT